MSHKQPPDQFNPYHKWLGIPEKKCPPTFYELLGISLNEDDPAVIQSAAERQKKHVEQFLGTSYNKFANQLIAQIDEAEITLLSPELRREYDRQVGLFKKRRKKRQFDPTVMIPPMQSGGNRTVGEGSGLAREYAGIVSVLVIAFFVMAAASFWLPWGKLEADNENVAKTNPHAKQPALAEEPAMAHRDKKGVAKKKSSMTAKTSLKTPEPEPKKAPEAKIETGDQKTNSIGMKFQLIPAGTFLMGATFQTRKNNEKPVHQVILTKPFEMGVYEVTQQQYEAVMGTNPSEFKGPDNPVEMVTWDNAVEFCIKLSNMPNEKGFIYRLPTEAEWEYACRAGTTTKYSYGDDDSQLDDYAWYFKNSSFKTHPVGEKKSNPWGLYDMQGNVFEWCQDWFDPYQSSVKTNPIQMGGRMKYRVIRGGGISNVANYCFSSARHNAAPDLKNSRMGFRVVRSSSQ
ncbi:formylglycine-generating enzyme family protein [uncultured Gimesia sp.]|uniref:formylglycine-generating enzyme family protein n=1 Tax=uncultured Gimesia sp. TaxID=1678688 RepID=UPI002638E3BF|nr:formylglycine-generating enzyme family protein [uncultured Gimesia sp.]